MDSRIEKKQTKDEVIYGIRKFKNTKSAIEVMEGVYGFDSSIVIGDDSFMQELVSRVALAYLWNKTGKIADENYKLMMGFDDDVTSYLFAFNFLVYNPRNKTYYVNRVEPSEDTNELGFHFSQELDDRGWKLFDELWTAYNVQKNIKSINANLDTFAKEKYADKELDEYFVERFMAWMYGEEEGGFVEQTPDEYGYMTVNLINDDGVEETKYVHELIAQTFVPNPNNLPYVKHKDGNKQNNRADNLEWTDEKPEYVKD